jgi:hypothetical protein
MTTIRFRADSWQEMTRVRAGSNELAEAEPYLQQSVTNDDGTGLRYVVALPDDIARTLQEFLYRHQQVVGATVQSVAERGGHDRALAEKFVGAVHAWQDVLAALVIAGRLGD